MLRNIRSVAVLACTVLALAAPPTTSAEKERPALSGAWVKKDGEPRLEFSGRDGLTVVPHTDKGLLTILCTYTLEKGRVEARISGHEGKAREKAAEKLPIGFRFSFAWKAKGDTATLDDLKGEGEHVERLKSHLEGEYKQKK